SPESGPPKPPEPRPPHEPRDIALPRIRPGRKPPPPPPPYPRGPPERKRKISRKIPPIIRGQGIESPGVLRTRRGSCVVIVTFFALATVEPMVSAAAIRASP